MKNEYRKGMHVICKMHGRNGDLVVGRIESVRSNGDIVGLNLLTGSRFTKRVDVLRRRNIICSKLIADKVLKESAGDRASARERAVAYARILRGPSGKALAEHGGIAVTAKESRLLGALTELGQLTRRVDALTERVSKLLGGHRYAAMTAVSK